MEFLLVKNLNNILDILVIFQKNNPNIYIGGSVSLILQEAIPYRIPKDIDLISPNRIHIFDLFNETKFQHRIIRQYKYEGLKFELFINPNAKYIEYNYQNNIIKLSPVDEIFEWKFREKNLKNEKHLNDINIYNKND
jgi:hypothetical protein